MGSIEDEMESLLNGDSDVNCGWEYAIKHRSFLLRTARKYGGLRYADELYSYVLERLPQAYERAKKNARDVGAFMNLFVRSRMYRYANYLYAKEAKRLTVDIGFTEFPLLDNRDQVQDILGQLSESDRAILTLYHYQGYTFRSIGEKIGTSTMRVIQLYNEALLNAQEVARRYET